MLHGEKIVCISTIGWDFVWSRVQPFMQILAEEGNQILYVEPITSLPTRLAFPEYRLVQAGLRAKLRQVRPNIHVLTPPMLLPLSSRSFLACQVNQWILGRILRSALRRLGWERPILWTYSPYSVHLLGKLGEQFVLYDCTDERTANPWVSKKVVSHLETALMRRANLVVVTSRGLLERKQALTSDIILIPNGVDFKRFAEAQNLPVSLPADVASVPRPRVGFVGAIFHWVDLELLAFVAKARPNWAIVLVGPVGRGVDVQHLRELTNMHLLGPKPWTDIPEYLRAFDVCIVPFRVSAAITATANPIKVYEYLAAGKPIISVDLPEVRSLKSVVRLAQGYDDFVVETQEALADDNAELRQERIATARAYDWRALMERLCAELEWRLMTRKGREGNVPQRLR